MASTEKPNDILNAARELFARHGYEKTGVKEIARGANVALATIYAHFDGKLGVLEALIDREVQRLVGELATLVGGDPVEVLLEGVRILGHNLAGDPFLRALLTSTGARAEPRLREHGEKIIALFDRLGREAAQHAVRAGRLRCEDAEALTVLLRVTTLGWLETEAGRPGEVSHDRVMSVLIGLVRRGAVEERS